MGEIRDLVKNPTDGIRYVENDEDTVSEIHAVLDGPGQQILSHLFIAILKSCQTQKTDTSQKELRLLEDASE